MRPVRRVWAGIAAMAVLLGSAPVALTQTAPPRDPKAQQLATDVWIISGGMLPISLGRRKFKIMLAPDAATSGDVWLIDPRSGIAALGDLVTLPVPFLDTACPEGWKAALAQVSATPFWMAIPGLGAPMQRRQFDLYRQAFVSFIDCSNSDRPAGDCATNWANAVQPLLPADPAELRRTQSMAEYYIGLLRANGGRSKYCEAQPSAKPDG